MRSKLEIRKAHAERCTQMAIAVHYRRVKSLFLDLAYQWRELADTARSLGVDAKARERETTDLSKR